jgi:hypothetical protein
MWPFKKKPYRVILKDGRTTLIYDERGRRMELAAERLSGAEFDVLVYGRTMRWLPPHEALAVTSEDQARIRQNIKEGLRMFRLDWED